MTSQKTTKYTDFDPSKLTFTQLEENDRSKGQRIAFADYEGGKLMLQMPWTKIISGGVPRLGDYYSNDRDRGFVKMPFDFENPESRALFDILSKLDEILSSKEKREEFHGPKKAKKYTYIPIVRQPQVDEDYEGPEKPPYMKVKLSFAYPEDTVLTQCYISELDETGKRIRKLVSTDTVDEFAEHVRYLSKVRLIIQPVKMWAQPPSKPDAQYGVTFKIIKAEVEPSGNSSGSLTSYMTNDQFVDSDEDDDNDEKKAESKNENNDDNNDDNSEESEDSDEDDSSESEPEPEPEPMKKKKNTKAKSKSKAAKA